MARQLLALFAGIVFGVGLAWSQMVYPLKVLAFLDITGHWDPSLALVMAGALTVTLPLFPWILKCQRPLLAQTFHLPSQSDIDSPLLVGAALFGVGWGIAGYCPGPAIAALAIHWQEAVPFLLAVAAGGLAADLVGD